MRGWVARPIPHELLLAKWLKKVGLRWVAPGRTRDRRCRPCAVAEHRRTGERPQRRFRRSYLPQSCAILARIAPATARLIPSTVIAHSELQESEGQIIDQKRV